MEELKDRSKRVMGTIGEKKVDMLQRWEERSRDFIVSFLLLFGRDGPIVSLKFSGNLPEYNQVFSFSHIFGKTVKVNCYKHFHHLEVQLQVDVTLPIHLVHLKKT